MLLLILTLVPVFAVLFVADRLRARWYAAKARRENPQLSRYQHLGRLISTNSRNPRSPPAGIDERDWPTLRRYRVRFTLFGWIDFGVSAAVWVGAVYLLGWLAGA